MVGQLLTLLSYIEIDLAYEDIEENGAKPNNIWFLGSAFLNLSINFSLNIWSNSYPLPWKNATKQQNTIINPHTGTAYTHTGDGNYVNTKTDSVNIHQGGGQSLDTQTGKIKRLE